MHTQGIEIRARLHHHIEQMRNGRALVAAHISHPRLQQRLGDGQDAFAMENLTIAQLQGFDLFVK